jgi:Na+/H+ antiporter NhaD/arsenite permease-like protein
VDHPASAHPDDAARAITIIAGTFSAFLVNDTICLALTPLVLDLARSARRNPIPYLLAVGMGSNIGSTATITGNPQNMMIGSVSRIPYTDFTVALAPIALIGLVVTVVLIALFHRNEFGTGARFVTEPLPTRVHRAPMLRALAGAMTLIVLLFAGQPPAKVAIVIGALLLVTGRAKT